jgi:hypothetical protein
MGAARRILSQTLLEGHRVGEFYQGGAAFNCLEFNPQSSAISRRKQGRNFLTGFLDPAMVLKSIHQIAPSLAIRLFNFDTSYAFNSGEDFHHVLKLFTAVEACHDFDPQMFVLEAFLHIKRHDSI